MRFVEFSKQLIFQLYNLGREFDLDAESSMGDGRLEALGYVMGWLIFEYIQFM